MKSKTPLTLMELLIMILIFSLTAALCVQLFVAADRWSRENEQKDRAILSVKNTAEILKYTGGDLEEASNLLGGTVSGAQWTLLFDEEGQVIAQKEKAVYDVLVEVTDSGHRWLGTALVTARRTTDQKELFCITAAWQEVERDE